MQSAQEDVVDVGSNMTLDPDLNLAHATRGWSDRRQTIFYNKSSTPTSGKACIHAMYHTTIN
jgi:hypothetical protein